MYTRKTNPHISGNHRGCQRRTGCLIHLAFDRRNQHHQHGRANSLMPATTRMECPCTGRSESGTSAWPNQWDSPSGSEGRHRVVTKTVQGNPSLLEIQKIRRGTRRCPSVSLPAGTKDVTTVEEENQKQGDSSDDVDTMLNPVVQRQLVRLMQGQQNH